MSQLLINKSIKAEGAFSFSAVLNESVKPPMILYNGILQMDKYVDDISYIENERYLIKGVHIITEEFGSEDDSYGSTFTFKKFIDKRGVNSSVNN